MRKFLSLTLAVIMVALAIPFTVSAAAVTAPTTLSDGTEIEHTSITDGYLTQAGTANVFKNTKSMTKADNGKTYTIFNDGSVDLAEYSGIMTKVKQTSTGRLYMRWYIKFEGQTGNQYINAKGRTLKVWNGTEWLDCTSGAGDSNWQLPNLGKDGEAYVYLSFDQVKDKEFVDFGSVAVDLTIHSAKGTNRLGVFSEWSLISDAKDTPELAPDGSKMVLTSITDGTMTNPGTNEANISKFASQFDNTTKTIFDDVKVIDTTYCKGMLLRVNSTKSLVQWRFIITCEGVETAYEVKKKAFSWWDGTEWKDGEPKDNNNGLTSSGYVYVAFDELDLPSNKITNLKLYSAKSASRAGVFSKWSLVQTELQAEEHPLVEERTYDKTSHVIKGIQYFDNAGDTYSIRLVGGIDGYEKYDRVGYEVSFFNGVDKIGTLDAMSASAYISINQNVDGRINAITAEQLGVKYITAIAITDIPETCSTYVVASYVIVDGNKVYSNKVTINRHDDWNK